MILGNGGMETMTPFKVGHVNLRPRRHQKNSSVVAVRLTKRCQHRLACQVLKAGSGIDQASIEEHPAV